MKTNYIKDVDPTKLATPLRVLLKNFAASPYKMAPEREGELKEFVDGLGVRIILDATTDLFDFQIDPITKKITAGLAALERL